MPVDLVSVINEVFALKPPSVEDFPPDELNESLVDTSEWRLAGAQRQYADMYPLVMAMARALEEMLTRNEAQAALLREAEDINDRYDAILKSLLPPEEKS